MTGTTLVATAFFYMQDTFGLEREPALDLAGLAAILIVVFGALATVPSGADVGPDRQEADDLRVGGHRARSGWPCWRSPRRPVFALAFAVPIGVASGIFLAVDWALMTDIIPKAESGSLHGHQQRRHRLRRRDRDGRRARPRWMPATTPSASGAGRVWRSPSPAPTTSSARCS